MNPKKWTEKVAALPPGMELHKIAARFKVSYSRASRILSAYGYKFTRKRSVSNINRAKQLIKKGLSNVEIAGALKISRERARKIREMFGLPKVESRGRKAGKSPYRLNGDK